MLISGCHIYGLERQSLRNNQQCSETQRRESGNQALVQFLLLLSLEIWAGYSTFLGMFPHLLAEMVSKTLIPLIPTWPFDNLKHISPIFMNVSKRMHLVRMLFFLQS